MSYVSVGRRFVAYLIDVIILGLVTAPFGSYDFDNGTASYRVVGAPFLLQQLVWIAYFVILEATLGATLGKLALGIRVLRADGTKLDWGASIVRNILRIVDAIPYFIPYLLGAILVWTSPTRQRLGDRAASTIVVRKDSVGAPVLGDAAASRGQAPRAPRAPQAPPPPGATG
jgi:uncharacterized RDD family membrane protein YckC